MQAKSRIMSETERQRSEDHKAASNRAHDLAKAKEMANAHRMKIEREESMQAARERAAAAERWDDHRSVAAPRVHLAACGDDDAAQAARHPSAAGAERPGDAR